MSPIQAFSLFAGVMILVLVIAKMFDNLFNIPTPNKFSLSKAMLTMTIISAFVGFFLNPIGGAGVFLLSAAVLLEVKRSRST